MAALATFVLFYLMTVFALSWGTSALGFTRQRFLLIQLFGILFFAVTIPCSAVLADRFGRRRTLLWVSAAIAAFGFLFAPLLGAGTVGATAMMALGLSLMGVLGNNLIALNDRVAVSGGFGVGFDYGSGDNVYGGRVGLQWTR